MRTDRRADRHDETNGLFRQLWETLKRRRLGDKERRHNVRRQFLYHTHEWRVDVYTNLRQQLRFFYEF
jgi:hypothetical protein